MTILFYDSSLGTTTEYATFVALIAAKTLAANDDVDGQSTTYNEQWLPDGAGTSGNLVSIHDATINAAGGDYALRTLYDYHDYSDLVLSGGVLANLGGFNADHIYIHGLISTGSVSALRVAGTAVDWLIEDFNIAGHTGGSYGAFQLPSTGARDWIVRKGVVAGGGPRGLFFTVTSNLTLDDLVIAGVTGTGTGLEIASMTSGNLILSNLYCGVTKAGDSGANFGPGMLIRSNVCDFSLDLLRAKNNGSYGLWFTLCTFGVGAVANDVDASNNDGTGCYIDRTNAIAFTNSKFNYNGIVGLTIDATASGHTFDSCEFIGNGGDGMGAKTAATNTVFKRCVFQDNGTVGDGITQGSGDGVSFHNTCTGEIQFSLQSGNLNTGMAHTGASSLEIYHNTCLNNKPDVDATMTRAEMYLTGTGGFTVKNSVVMHVGPEFYPLVWCDPTIGHTFDYNCYISDSLTPFYNSNTAVLVSFAGWVAAVGNETHSIFIHKNGNSYDIYRGSAPTVVALTLAYCPVLSTGRLANRADNPLIGSGTWITGVNDTGEADLWGNYVHRLPNIGADQGAGLPICKEGKAYGSAFNSVLG